MGKIINGNLNDKSNSRGWFIGHFLEDNSIFKNKEFEVKWGKHPKGEKKFQVAANKIAKTIGILIEGKIELNFPKNKKKILLSKQGDFIFFDEKIFHTFEALEDSIIIVIRWPSIPNDQFPLS